MAAEIIEMPYDKWEKISNRSPSIKPAKPTSEENFSTNHDWKICTPHVEITHLHLLSKIENEKWKSPRKWNWNQNRRKPRRLSRPLFGNSENQPHTRKKKTTLHRNEESDENLTLIFRQKLNRTNQLHYDIPSKPSEENREKISGKHRNHVYQLTTAWRNQHPLS